MCDLTLGVEWCHWYPEYITVLSKARELIHSKERSSSENPVVNVEHQSSVTVSISSTGSTTSHTFTVHLSVL